MKSFARCVTVVVACVNLCLSSPAGATGGTSATAQLQNGYAKYEKFCDSNGTVTYRVANQTVTVLVDLHSLIPKKQYALDWQNNKIRGYTIGTFKTTSTGAVVMGSLRLFRDAETHGIGVMVYYLSGFNPKATLRFKPC